MAIARTTHAPRWLCPRRFRALWLILCGLPVSLDALGVVQGSRAISSPRRTGPTPCPGHAPMRDRRRLYRRGLSRAPGSRRSSGGGVINTYRGCFIVVISLTFGTLGGYALSRSGYRYTFWLLIAALIFAPCRHHAGSGYLLPFFEWNLWGICRPTIIVLVAINQPFTLWMLHSFFPEHPEGSRRKRHGRWLHPVSGFPPCHHPGDVAGGDHHRAVSVPAGL